MRLGIIGARSIIDILVKVIQSQPKDIELLTVETEIITDTPRRAHELHGKVDALLFTGPYNYYYTLEHSPKPKIPWSCIPHNRVSALQSLLQASVMLHSDLKHISLDTYDPEIMQEALLTAGVQDAMIYTAKIDSDAPDLNERLVRAHTQRYQQNPETICLTSHEVCHELLSKAGIPCVRIFPAKELIMEQVYYLQLQYQNASKQEGNCAVIAIHYNYVFDNEKDPALRDWEKLRYQHQIREYVYTMAHKLQAAVFSDDIVPLFIVTSREMLDNVFFKQQDHIKLLQFGQQEQHFQVCLGIGLGNTMLDAKSQATMALNHAFRDLNVHAYIAKDNAHKAAPAVTEATLAKHHAKVLAEHCGFTLATLQKLSVALEQTGNPTTAEALAQALKMNIRSVNRILTKLEDAGCVQIVAKQGHGRGRPTRVMKLLL